MSEVKTRKIPMSQVHVETLDFRNPRQSSGLSEESIQELARDIEVRGMLNPILVWAISRDCYVILAGQRRYLAARHLGLSEIEARVIHAETIEDAKATALVDNLHREQLSTYETAVALADMEGTQEEIANRVTISEGHVSKLLSTLRQSCPEVIEAWKTNKIAFKKAFQISRLPKDEQAEALAGARRKSKRPTIREVKEVYRSIGRPKDDYHRGIRDALEFVVSGKALS